jgi:hypothetical protein
MSPAPNYDSLALKKPRALRGFFMPAVLLVTG